MSEAAVITPSFEDMRHAMVASQLRTNAVNDARVVAAMAEVPRERFVPEAARAFAYADAPVRLGRGRAMNAPVATGRLITEAGVRPTDHVLLIGASTGYAAALLGALAASVVAVETDAGLAETAREALAGQGNVMVVEGPLEAGAPAHAPYDLLVVDGAVEQLPEALVAQVKPGGRLVSGLVDRGVTRLASGGKSHGGFGLVDFADIDCVVLPGFAKPRGFSF